MPKRNTVKQTQDSAAIKAAVKKLQKEGIDCGNCALHHHDATLRREKFREFVDHNCNNRFTQKQHQEIMTVCGATPSKYPNLCNYDYFLATALKLAVNIS
jgi:uncharacterized ferredoxin-like protein